MCLLVQRLVTYFYVANVTHRLLKMYSIHNNTSCALKCLASSDTRCVGDMHYTMYQPTHCLCGTRRFKEEGIYWYKVGLDVAVPPVFSLGLYGRALCPLGPLMCPLDLPQSQQCALWVSHKPQNRQFSFCIQQPLKLRILELMKTDRPLKLSVNSW